MRKRERYYTEPLSNDKAYLKGWAAVNRILSASPSIKRIAIITRLLNSTGFLESFFNNTGAPRLFAEGPVLFPGTTKYAIHSAMKKHVAIQDEIVVTLGLDSDDLLYLEDQITSAFMVAVPWIDGEVKKWSKITGALEVQTLVPATFYVQPDCILREALNDMSIINITSVPFHSNDYDRVKTYFKALHDTGIDVDVDIMESYLFKDKGWSKRSVDHALTIFLAIKQGRKIKGKVGDTNYFITKWRNACS